MMDPHVVATRHPSLINGGVNPEKMPGHWLLASLGKKVLRPGGLFLTKAMLSALNIGQEDHVVEFAPGLGLTAKITMACKPQSYIAVERDPDAVSHVQQLLTRPEYQCVEGNAAETFIESETATVVYGEAMLSMQTLEQKRQIIGEAYRLLKPGGRYGIHELLLQADDEVTCRTIRKEMSQAIHVGVQPLTMAEWQELLESVGFEVQCVKIAPMHLLEPKRMIEDEGLFRVLRILSRLLVNPQARNRVFQMRNVFRKYRHQLGAVTIVCRKTASVEKS